MLKAVGVALSLVVLFGVVVAIACGEIAVAVALAAILCGVIGYRKQRDDKGKSTPRSLMPAVPLPLYRDVKLFRGVPSLSTVSTEG